MSDELKWAGTLGLGRDQHLISDKRILLLEKVAAYGSISQAAKAAGLSYKGAWDAIDAMNHLYEKPLVLTSTGGKGGGGAKLSEEAVSMIDAYRALKKQHQQFMAAMNAEFQDFSNVYKMLRRLSVKTSARNQFFGKVTAIKQGPVNVEVVLTMTGGTPIHAVITHDGLSELGLTVGSEAWALVKASWVILVMPEAVVGVSARNKLSGKITRIVPGNVNSEIKLAIASGNVVSMVVTNDSVQELGLQEGTPAYAVFKASSVILGVNDT